MAPSRPLLPLADHWGLDVSTVRSRSHYFERGLESATASLAYLYYLDGNYYSGYQTETFSDEQKAWSNVDGLKGAVVEVSYNPRSPQTSVLRHPPRHSASNTTSHVTSVISTVLT